MVVYVTLGFMLYAFVRVWVFERKTINTLNFLYESGFCSSIILIVTILFITPPYPVFFLFTLYFFALSLPNS